jgi:ABC-type phosphate/phosphonate transport system ATPase subunit
MYTSGTSSQIGTITANTGLTSAKVQLIDRSEVLSTCLGAYLDTSNNLSILFNLLTSTGT